MEALVEDLLLLAPQTSEGSRSAKHVDVDVIAEGDAARCVASTRSTFILKLTRPHDRRHQRDFANASQPVDNAVRHAKSRIAIASQTRGDQVVLSVSDDGPGIPVATGFGCSIASSSR